MRIGLKRSRTGKTPQIQQDHSRAVWKKVAFILALVGIIILASGAIITIGLMPITIVEVYRTILNRLYRVPSSSNRRWTTSSG